MGRSVFGWDLPPGCSMKDIDNAFGEDADPLEAFSTYCEKNPNYLKPVLKTELERINTLETPQTSATYLLMDKVAEWAYQQGYDQGKSDQAEAEAFEQVSIERREFEELQELRASQQEENDIFRSE